MTAANTYTGGTTISGGILQLGNGGSSGTISGAIIDNGQLSLDRSDTGLILSGVISGTGTLVQMGTGTSTLSGTNTYSGGTTISGGILSVAADTNLGSGPISISNNAELLTTGAAFSSSKTLALGTLGGTVASATGTTATYSGALSGTTTFNVGDATNTGTVILTNANNVAGSVNVNAGTLRLAAGGQLTAGSGSTIAPTAANSATLSVDGSGTSLTISAGLYVGYGGTGILTVTNNAAVNLSFLVVGVTNTSAGTGTVTVDGASTSTPTVTTLSTYLAFGGPGTLNILNGAIFNNSGTGFQVEDLGWSASLNVSGAGAKLNINGATDYLQIGAGGTYRPICIGNCAKWR